MHRRRFLATVASVSGAGCAAGGVGDLGNEGSDPGHTEDGGASRSCLGETPTMAPLSERTLDLSVEQPGTDDESVVVENAGGGVAVLSDHEVVYGPAPSFTFGSLALMPGAGVRVVSQGAPDATLDSCPPDYVRHAGFGKAVLESATVVRLVTPAGDTVVTGDDGAD